jgi:hypothetical protein
MKKTATKASKTAPKGKAAKAAPKAFAAPKAAKAKKGKAAMDTDGDMDC